MSNRTLLNPFELGDMTLANRIALAPMTRARSGEDRIPTAIMVEYYAQRASAGLLITEATTISEMANGWIQSPGIYTEAMVEGWKKVVDSVHRQAGRIFLQLWHMGRASHSSFHGGRLSVAPSAIRINEDYIHTPNGKQPHEVPRALDSSEIGSIIEEYRLAAVNARHAGFDGVEIHAANGYLIDQFLQSKTNHRTDAWGGSVANRYRFLREVVEAILTVWPANRVAVRISPNGSFNDMGSPDFRDQFTYVAQELDQYGLAFLHVVDGLGFGFHQLGVPMTLADFRPVFKGPLMGNCGYNMETAEQAVSSGAADMISFGRPFISNPDLVERFRNNWPLAPESPIADWYSPVGSRGYTDFPNYKSE